MKDPIRVTTVTRIWKAIRRRFTPSEWVVWLLGLTRSNAKPTESGLILIQIDGLSKKQLERAIDDGRMPFLKTLLRKEHYINHTFYSGLPSSTPAVQAELYYGDRTVVPAFGFRDHRTGRLVRMFENEVAEEVESRLAQETTGLLAGGSSYCNIYSGGAGEVHFCATSFGWNEFLNTVNPFRILLVMLLSFWIFFRTFGLMCLELLLATFDFVRGVFSGKQFWQELIMIPARVVVVVLMRELVTIGACYDSARGLPVIHLNLLGYDEQAHRRGPESRFAHWTLKGIDRAIARIWRSAHRGAGREYDFWIFSDHGQEETTPYQLTHGKLIQQVVAEVVDKDCPLPKTPVGQKMNRLPTRANWLGFGWVVSMLFGEQDHDIQLRSPLVQTVTSGPVGFVYLLTSEVRSRKATIARRLVDEFHVPMCAVTGADGTSHVFTQRGRFDLPQEANKVFGADHPFTDEIKVDLVRMIEHPDAGDILIIGWDSTRETSSFCLQNGAHAGPGTEETQGFAMLPSDTLLPVNKRAYLRPNDLRLAGLRFLGRDEHGEMIRAKRRCDSVIRVLTYNVHACVGMDGLLSPERIARVIGQSEADIICLQELDVLRRRSGNRDQAHAIAQILKMSHQFHPAWHLEEEQFGNAVLTRFPMRVIQKEGLHHHREDRSRRSALWVEVDIGNDISLQVVNSHLSIYPQEQRTQAKQLLDEWVSPANLLGPVVLCGDFNARPNSQTHQILSETMNDIESFDSNPTRRTLFSPMPFSRVDHGFVTSEISVQRVSVIDSRLAKVASDHLPVMFDLMINAKSPDEQGITSQLETANSNKQGAT